MSFPRLLIILLLVLTQGCQWLPTSGSFIAQPPFVTELANLDDWLAVSHRARALSADEAARALEQLHKQDPNKPEAGLQLFYYACLNQQLASRDGWVQARDAFRTLVNDPALESGPKELARILLDYNQALINWHERHRHLQKELAESVLDRERLEQNIMALTELETNMSQQRQQDSLPPVVAEPAVELPDKAQPAPNANSQ